MPKTEENFEIEKRRKQIDKDLAHLIEKYLRIFEWEIPETDTTRARGLIIDELRLALQRLEQGGQAAS